MIQIDLKACISCGACITACPSGAIQLAEGSAVIDEKKCIQCRRCIYKCYTRAIKETPAKNK